MGNRLTRIYTRGGDDGTTGLGDGTRVSKDNDRVESVGTVDELNCLIGLILTETPAGELWNLLTSIQHRLFDLGGELAIPGTRLIEEDLAAELESDLDRINTGLPPLAEFVLPGGSRGAAICHQARAVCRRAERRLVRLARSEPVNPASLRFLNRLSDLLFVIARQLNRDQRVAESTWRRAAGDGAEEPAP